MLSLCSNVFGKEFSKVIIINHFINSLVSRKISRNTVSEIWIISDIPWNYGWDIFLSIIKWLGLFILET